jgi:hypothetical protein
MEDKEQRIKIQFETNAAEAANLVRSLEEAENNLKNANEALANSSDKTAAGIKILEKTVVDAKRTVNENTDALNNNKKALAVIEIESAKTTTTTKSLADSVIKNNAAFGILNTLTGGLAGGLKEAYEASDLFSGGINKMLKSVKTFSTGAKAALISTGIGALVVLVGVLMTYWDDLKGLVSGVSGEMKSQGKIAEENAATEQSKLDTLNGQDNILKSQGKSEKEILQIKQKQTAETITALQAQLESQKTIVDAQISASKRNRDILSGILKFVSSPITLLLGAIDLAGKAFGKDFNLLGNFDKVSELLFDPKAVKEEGKKTLDETTKQLNALKNTQAGYQNSINDIDKTAKDKKAAADIIINDTKNALIKEGIDKETALRIANEDLLDKTEEQKLQRQKKRAAQEIKDLEKKGIDTAAITILNAEKFKTLEQELEAKRVEEKFAKENALRIANEDLLDKTEEQKLARQKERAAQEIRDLEKKGIDTAAMIILNDAKFKILDEELKAKRVEEKFAKDIETNATKAENEKLDFESRLRILAESDALILANTKLTEEEKNKLLQDNANKRADIEKAIKDFKEQELQKNLANLQNILSIGGKKMQNVSKALAVADVVRTTVKSVHDSIAGIGEANSLALATPAAIASFGASAVPVIARNTIQGGLQIGSTIASAAKAIQSITSESKSVPSGGKGLAGGGGGGSAGGATPQVAFQASSENQIGNTVANNLNAQPPIQAFVVSSAVTNAQQLDNNRIKSNSI